MSAGRVDVSVVCAVGRFPTSLPQLFRAYADAVRATGRSAEFVFVVSGARRNQVEALRSIETLPFPVRICRMAGGWGESTALHYAFERANGRYVVTIPDHFQVDPAVLGDMLDRLDRGADVVTAYRSPSGGSLFNRLQVSVFNRVVRYVTQVRFKDLTCGLRAMTIDAARRLDLYGDHHRFIPVLAVRFGLRVVEVPATPRPDDRTARMRSPGIYARRLLDILNIYFLTRFTQKPLRFFGLVGMGLGTIGFLVCLVLAIQRLFFGEALADRPLLLLGVLLIVLGVQVASIGMVGEIVIFLASKRDLPEFEEVELGPSEPAAIPDEATRDHRSG